MREREIRNLVLAHLAAHLAHLARAYVVPTIAYAQEMVRRETVSPEQQAQVRAMIAILGEATRLFLGPIRYRLLPKLEQANQRVAGALINLSAWDSNETALEFWAQTIRGARRDWRHLAEVATGPLLEGKANWTTAERPVPYIAEAARNRRRTEETACLPSPREVPLEDVPEPRALDPAPADDSFERLIAATLSGADAEVKAYGELVLRGSTHEEARRALGWYKKRAQRVEVRYRRHRKAAAKTSDVRTLRRVLEDWRDQASRTVERVTFADADGRRHGYFKHRDSWKNPPET